MTMQEYDFRYIESNPLVCHGKWVFRGTRILVSVVQAQIKRGMPADEIVEEWSGKVSLAAIDEVVTYGVRDADCMYEAADHLTS